jgi:Protein of unknown function (DUF1579)
MKRRLLMCVAVLIVAASAAGAEGPNTRHATKTSKVAPAMDPKAMEAMMEKAAMVGPHHARFKQMEGTWDASVTWNMGPGQPEQKSTSTSVIKTLMDGRYMQEEATGEMMGRPFNGMGITGYDNVSQKYVNSWIDNAGTGIMQSTGTPDASGSTINWVGTMNDPVSGKAQHYRMVSHWTDNDHYTYEMYSKMPPSMKEMKVMSIEYTRK